MSIEQMTRGIELIGSAARKAGLRLGSRAVDSFRGIVRFSFEKEILKGSRPQLRAPAFDFYQEFVEDLPAQKKYQKELADFLESLSLRLTQANAHQFLTLSGVPISLEVHWPFRPVQASDDMFIHVLGRVGTPWSWEANFTVVFSAIDQHEMNVYSLSPPGVEFLIVNAVRSALDKGKVRFYSVGQHPSNLQTVRISADFLEKSMPMDTDVRDFILRKVYWLGFREGEDATPVPIADPYDSKYLGRSEARLRQLGRVLSATGKIRLDPATELAWPTDELLRESDQFERELEQLMNGGRAANETPYATDQPVHRSNPSIFLSYSSEDAPFAESLANALSDRNIGVWLDRWEIRVGDSLTKKIGQALHDNDFIVVVLSPSSARSEWVRRELAEALNREIAQKRVVVLPVIARPCEIPPFLTDKKYADFTRDPNAALSSLIDAIKGHHQARRG